MKIASLFVVLLASLVLVACGGNDANTGGTNSGSGSACTGGKEPEKVATPAELRAEVAKKMAAAMEALDGAAVKALFHEDEQENAEKRIVTALQEMKDKGIKVKSAEPTFEEKDGKFFASFPHTITEGETSADESNTLALIEKDGKWWLSFKR